MNVVEAANGRLTDNSLATEKTAQRIEAADFADSALKLTEAQTALEAVIQTRGTTNRRSLIDYLG
jgi:flagellin-like hook-associated protein FlgL